MQAETYRKTSKHVKNCQLSCWTCALWLSEHHNNLYLGHKQHFNYFPPEPLSNSKRIRRCDSQTWMSVDQLKKADPRKTTNMACIYHKFLILFVLVWYAWFKINIVGIAPIVTWKHVHGIWNTKIVPRSYLCSSTKLIFVVLLNLNDESFLI